MTSSEHTPTGSYLAPFCNAFNGIIAQLRALNISRSEASHCLRSIADIIDSASLSAPDAKAALADTVSLQDAPPDDDELTALQEAIDAIEAALAQISESHAHSAEILAKLSVWHTHGGLSRLGDHLAGPRAYDVLADADPVLNSDREFDADGVASILEKLRQAGLWVFHTPDGRFAVATNDESGMRSTTVSDGPKPQPKENFRDELARLVSSAVTPPAGARFYHDQADLEGFAVDAPEATPAAATAAQVAMLSKSLHTLRTYLEWLRCAGVNVINDLTGYTVAVPSGRAMAVAVPATPQGVRSFYEELAEASIIPARQTAAQEQSIWIHLFPKRARWAAIMSGDDEMKGGCATHPADALHDLADTWGTGTFRGIQGTVAPSEPAPAVEPPAADKLPDWTAASVIARLIVSRQGSVPQAIDDALAAGHTDETIRSAFLSLAKHALGN
jgi:hypothetical protein